jgi:hypothetical protein
MSKESDQVECVGSLLVHSSDVQELTDEAALGNKGDAKNTIECVGSLVVPSQEVEELNDVKLPEVNLKKRVTAVGTLLVPSDDDDKKE